MCSQLFRIQHIYKNTLQKETTFHSLKLWFSTAWLIEVSKNRVTITLNILIDTIVLEKQPGCSMSLKITAFAKKKLQESSGYLVDK